MPENKLFLTYQNRDSTFNWLGNSFPPVMFTADSEASVKVVKQNGGQVLSRGLSLAEAKEQVKLSHKPLQETLIFGG